MIVPGWLCATIMVGCDGNGSRGDVEGNAESASTANAPVDAADQGAPVETAESSAPSAAERNAQQMSDYEAMIGSD